MALKPGSAEWLKVISASKMPAILGISPWESPFSLWHRMHGDVGKQEGNGATERGEFVEESIIKWLAYKLETPVEPGQQTEHPDHPDWIATPDGQVRVGGAVCGVEAKSQAYDTEWGEEGSADIPPYYLAQVAWQMIVCGYRRVYVPVLFGLPFEFRLYVVEWSDVEADVPLIIEAVEKFQQSLRDGTPPPIDGATSTYQVIRELHPDIDGETVEVPADLAIGFKASKAFLDEATAGHQEAKSLVADLMGTAQYATHEGVRIARRQAGRNGATPFVVAVKPPKKKEANA